ncbi:MAG: molybdenum cofactor biosynthesis protein MoaE [Solirubrobacteraceae bacterium]|nr:molybdenum cofactor biosynthesis protein MoaE [Solirubrobacteraceae bacterium]
MEVSVRLFAGLRELVGSDSLQLELADGASVADALAALSGQVDASGCLLAVNREYADDDLVLAAGDELALIPPVSGGAAQAHVALSDSPLSLDALLERVRDPRAGAVVSFSGVTREVDSLDYEVYAEMALEQMARIVGAAIERHGLCAAAAEHRVGKVPLSEASVIVAASAPHRGEAFAGAREIIDELKACAPIWKVEVEGEERRRVAGAAPKRPQD